MGAFCQQHGITLLAYGSLLGGLLSEKYLGRAEPGRGELTTASLQKYTRMIAAWGGWSLFQELLAALKTVADKHGVSIANVGARYVLDRPAVAGVIIGARVDQLDGDLRHLAEAQNRVALPIARADPGAVEPHSFLQGPARRVDDAASSWLIAPSGLMTRPASAAHHTRTRRTLSSTSTSATTAA